MPRRPDSLRRAVRSLLDTRPPKSFHVGRVKLEHDLGYHMSHLPFEPTVVWYKVTIGGHGVGKLVILREWGSVVEPEYWWETKDVRRTRPSWYNVNFYPAVSAAQRLRPDGRRGVYSENYETLREAIQGGAHIAETYTLHRSEH